MDNIKTILLTGASGFLGSKMLEKLVGRYNVIVIARPTSDLWRVKHLENRYQLYIDKTNDYKTLFSENSIDAVIHLATDYGHRCGSFADILQSNVIFPLRLLESAESHKVKLFINTDTFSAQKGSRYSYLNNYNQSKLIFRNIIEGHQGDVHIANMKLEHVFGENDGNNKFVAGLVRDLLLNKTQIDLTIGTQRRDFVYVDDVIDAYCMVLTKILDLNKKYNEFEVGTGVSYSIREFAEIAKKLSNSSTTLNFGAVPMRDNEFIESKANTAALEKLGWISKFTLEKGLSKCIDKERGNTSTLKKSGK